MGSSVTEYNRYAYDGPVLEFDKVVAEHWKAETIAISDKKARTNLTYRFKKEHNKVPGTKITLPGKLTKIN